MDLYPLFQFGFLVLWLAVVVGAVIANIKRVRDAQYFTPGLQRYRFRREALCPACLSVGQVDLVCRACGQSAPLELLLPVTASAGGGRGYPSPLGVPGVGQDLCSGCLALLRDRARADRTGYCVRCAACSRELRPEVMTYSLRVLGALREADYQRLRETVGATLNLPVTEDSSAQPRRFTWTQEEFLTCVLCLEDLPEKPTALPPCHAAHRIWAVWVGGANPAPLSLARAADAYSRHLQRGAGDPAGLPVYAEAQRLKAHAAGVLDRTFARVYTGVSPAEILTDRLFPDLPGDGSLAGQRVPDSGAPETPQTPAPPTT